MISIKTNKKQRQLHFDGNSYLVGNQKMIAVTVYNSIISSGKTYSYQNYAISGRSTTELLGEFTTKVAPFIKNNDILVFYEIVNDLDDGNTATQAYNNVVSYCNLVRSYGVKVCVCTMCAVNYTGAPANIETSRVTVNTNIVNNWTTFADFMCDLGSKPEFDTQADCNNTTYYNADKLHMTDLGYQTIGGYIYTAIQTNL